jgi:hypothetical protein
MGVCVGGGVAHGLNAFVMATGWRNSEAANAVCAQYCSNLMVS